MVVSHYPYERRGFLLTTLLLLIVIVLVTAMLFQFSAEPWVLPSLMGILALALLSFGISPLLTSHSFDENALVIRQGIFFNGRIPLDNISSIERLERVKKRSGVFFALNEPTLYVTTRSIDLVCIHLVAPQRFKSVFGRKVEKVIIDSVENDRLISDIRRFIPANPDRPSSGRA